MQRRGQVSSPDDRYAEDDPHLAWSDLPRDYSRRRVWRYLRRSGQLNDPTHVHLAAGCLEQADEASDTPGHRHAMELE